MIHVFVMILAKECVSLAALPCQMVQGLGNVTETWGRPQGDPRVSGAAPRPMAIVPLPPCCANIRGEKFVRRMETSLCSLCVLHEGTPVWVWQRSARPASCLSGSARSRQSGGVGCVPVL